MEVIDLTVIPVEEKHLIIYKKVKALSQGEALAIRSLQDLVVLQSHIVDELGDTFSWEHRIVDEDVYELIIERI